MKIIIIGGGGFIATNLLVELSKIGVERDSIFTVDRAFPFQEVTDKLSRSVLGDFSKIDTAKQILASTNFDFVFHLAANSDIRKSSDNPEVELNDTLLTTLNLIRSAESLNIKFESLVFASTSAIYGEVTEPISEKTKAQPTSAYGWMKLASEAALKSARSAITNRLAIYRFPNVVGKYATHGVVFDLANQLRNRPESLRVLGDGTQNKPFMLASRLSEILVDLEINQVRTAEFEEFNIGPASATTVSHIAESLVAQSGLDIPIRFGESPIGWKGDVPAYSFDTKKISQAYTGSIESSDEAIRVAIQEALKKF
jgi:UDP-glucose 4-epimerase